MQRIWVICVTLTLLWGCAADLATPSNGAATAAKRSDVITVASYNVEHFADHFRGFHLEKEATTKPADAEMKDLIAAVKRFNNENQWEVANVINDPAFSPDVLCVVEGPEQSDLEFFNKRWLNSMYETVIVFPSNSQYHQTVDMLLKPGFKVIKRMDQYYKEKDTGTNARGANLFARGPAFVLVKAPSGFEFWVGVTHQKSKSGNSLEVTQWRNRESKRTHEIMKEIDALDDHDVILVGDMNDDLGLDEYEKDATSGGDAIANLVGPASDGFTLATKPLADKHEQSFHGYYNEKYRSLIDHAVVSKGMAPRVTSVELFHSPWTLVASDHLPLVVKIRAQPSATSGAAN